VFQKLQAQLEPRTAKLTSAYQRLNPKERMAVVFCVLLILSCILYLGVWAPLYKRANSAEQSYKYEVELSQWMKSKAPLVGGSSLGNNVKPLDRSLLSLVNETAGTHKLTLKNAESKGDDSIRIRLDDDLSDDVLKWIYQLYETYGVQVTSISMEEEDTPGKVRVNLILTKM